MKELPKELTPELLGLVFKYRIHKIDEIAYNELKLIIIDNSDSFQDKTINIDTLTRLMKEWLSEIYPNFAIKWINHKVIGTDDFQVKIWLNNVCIGKASTEFEAVLKATCFVAREKGLIDEV